MSTLALEHLYYCKGVLSLTLQTPYCSFFHDKKNYAKILRNIIQLIKQFILVILNSLISS